MVLHQPVTKVDGFGGALGLITAPGLTPQPLLRQTVDGHHVLGIVGEVLVEIGEGVRISRQLVVHRTQLQSVRDRDHNVACSCSCSCKRLGLGLDTGYAAADCLINVRRCQRMLGYAC